MDEVVAPEEDCRHLAATLAATPHAGKWSKGMEKGGGGWWRCWWRLAGGWGGGVGVMVGVVPCWWCVGGWGPPVIPSSNYLLRELFISN